MAGPFVRAACKRHLQDLIDGHRRGLRFDAALAQRAIDFYADELTLVSAPTPEQIERGERTGSSRQFVLEPAQEFIVGSVFGWVRANGMRRFRTVYVEMGKGNGKSPLVAGIGIYCLIADSEPEAEVYAAAGNKDQALIMFRDAVGMVGRSPSLSENLITSGGADPDNIAYPLRGSWFRAVGAGKKKSGYRPHCALIDEIHEHEDANVVDMMSAGQKGRRQPLTVEITNSGYDKQSVCYAHHEYSCRVVEGQENDDEWFAYVCAMDEGDDPLKDEGCWPKANPLLGVTIHNDYLRKQVREARGMPSKQSTVKRLNFCVWTDAKNPWIDGPTWLAVVEEYDAMAELAKCTEVFGGMDLSGTSDLTALALVGIRGTSMIARVEFWTPEETLKERELQDKTHYSLWRDQGHMIATPGRAVGYEFVAQRIKTLQQRLPQFKSIAFDPYRIKYFEKDLEAARVQITMKEHPQGYYKPQEKKDPTDPTGKKKTEVLWMPRSIELLTKRVTDKTIRVQRNPCLTWNSASAVLVADEKDNKIFGKRKSYGRIDGLVALAQACGLADAGGTITPPQPGIRWL